MSGELQGQEQLHSVKGSTDMVDNKTYNSRGTAYAHPGHICDNSQYPWSPIGLQHQQLVLGIDTSMGVCQLPWEQCPTNCMQDVYVSTSTLHA